MKLTSVVLVNINGSCGILCVDQKTGNNTVCPPLTYQCGRLVIKKKYRGRLGSDRETAIRRFPVNISGHIIFVLVELP